MRFLRVDRLLKYSPLKYGAMIATSLIIIHHLSMTDPNINRKYCWYLHRIKNDDH